MITRGRQDLEGPARLLPGPAQVTGVRCVLLQAEWSRHQGKRSPRRWREEKQGLCSALTHSPQAGAPPTPAPHPLPSPCKAWSQFAWTPCFHSQLGGCLGAKTGGPGVLPRKKETDKGVGVGGEIDNQRRKEAERQMDREGQRGV